jgi:hypothetical protein
MGNAASALGMCPDSLTVRAAVAHEIVHDRQPGIQIGDWLTTQRDYTSDSAHAIGCFLRLFVVKCMLLEMPTSRHLDRVGSFLRRDVFSGLDRPVGSSAIHAET